MYPNCPNFILSFEENSEKLMNLLDEKIKDISSRRLYDSLKEAADISQSIYNFIF